MAKASTMPPKESVRDWLIVRDGWLWWNPETIIKHGKNPLHYELSKPIRFDSKAEQATVMIEGRTYNVGRLNYWIHTGEWPECVIRRDNNKLNNHIDNLVAGNHSQANAHRVFDVRTYTIQEYVTKAGKRTYYPLMNMNNEKFVVGSYSTEAEAVQAAIAIRNILYGEFTPNDIKQC